MSLDQYHDLINYALTGTIDPIAQSQLQKILDKLAAGG
jgi:hypothetical protein